MKICIFDDEILELKKTKSLIEDYCDKTNIEYFIDTYTDASILKNKMECFPQECEYDIFFLDIIMQIEGIEIGKIIKNKFPNALIIFVTTSKDYAIDAFSVKAFDYILKPIDPIAFNDKMDEIIKSLKNKVKNAFTFKGSNHSVVSIGFENVVYIESLNRRMVIHLDSFEEISSPVLRNKFFDSIPFDINNHNFMICHSSYVVNLNQIRSIEKNYFVMKNDDIVPISKQYYQTVKKKYIDYLAGE